MARRKKFTVTLLVVVGVCAGALAGHRVWWGQEPSPSPQPPAAGADARIVAARASLLAALSRDLALDRAALSFARQDYLSAQADDAEGAARGLGLIAGLESALDGEVALARDALAQVVGEDEELLAGHALGVIALEEGESLEAWGEFDQLVRLRPAWSWARVWLIAADAGLGASEGIAVLTDAVTRWPRSAQLAAALGRALENVRSDPEAGSEWYARAVALGARDRHVVERFATFSLERGEAERVREILAPLVVAHPDQAFMKLHLGRAQAQLGEPAVAAGLLGAAVRLEPDNLDSRIQLATHLANMGDLTAAGAMLREGLLRSPREPKLTGYLGHIELASGNPDEARALLAASCGSGFDPSCIEACHLGDARSCGDGVFTAESVGLDQGAKPRRKPTFKGGAVTVAEHALGP